MKQLLFGSDELVTAWVCKRIGVPPLKCAAIGVVKDNRIIGGAIYFNYKGCDIEMGCAGEGRYWLSKEIIESLFRYPFKQLGCRRITGIVDKRAKRTRRFIEKLGFKLEGVAREALDGKDACIYGLLKKDFRYDWEERIVRSCTA